MKDFSFKEFRPTILFLVKFIGIYLVGNVLYGFYVTSYNPHPDPATHWVSQQTATVLSFIGYETKIIDHARRSTTLLLYQDNAILSVYEGCNGLNVFIVFAAFVIGFGPFQKAMLWFIPLGLLIIHIFNLFRIGGLFFIVLYSPHVLYFTHKYLFTAFIYLIVFLLWIWWVKVFSLKKTSHE